MADRQLLSNDVEAAPKVYTLPPAQELLLKACYAEYDGASAVGAFLPTLQIVSDADAVVASIPMDEQIAAGASVVATWAPFLGSRRTTGGCSGNIDSTANSGASCGVHSSGASAGDVLESDGVGGSVWQAGGGGGYVPGSAMGVYNVAPVNILASGASTGSLVYVRGSALLNLAVPDNPTVITRGVYAVSASYQGSGAFSVGTVLAAQIFAGHATNANGYSSAPTRSPTVGPLGQVCLTVPMESGENFQFGLGNRDTAAHFCEWLEIVVTLICVY